MPFLLGLRVHGLVAGREGETRRALPLVEPNDNRQPAGNLQDGVLTLRLVVDSARWYPEAADGPSIDVVAFSEEGRPPQVPGPLVRVPRGTIVNATIRNALADSTIYVWGFVTRPSLALDSVPIKPGESRNLQFEAGEPGTYLYRAMIGVWDYEKHGEREQLTGAIVVDSANTPTDDRIFVINIWSGYTNPKDTTTDANALAINGRSWPHTERIAATVGDSLRWRFINGSGRSHPMHLHGFYFRVDARGDAKRDTVFEAGNRRLVVTEDLSPGHSVTLVMKPEREGNWLFHCHLAFHVVHGANLSDRTNSGHSLHSGDPKLHMSGLVLGINVKPSPSAVAERRTNVRRMNLFVQEGKPRGRAPRALGFVLQRGGRAPAKDSVEIPGSVIVVTRGEPTDITVVNRLKEATSVHWHGIELESYSDGVPGWSGMEKRLAPMIAPGKSFTARLTLRRSGTFIYHTHLNDVEQLTSGLYGAMVVLERGQKFDPKTDHVFIAGWDGDYQPPAIVINGDSASGPPLELSLGVANRFRFINIGPAQRLFFSLRRDTTVVKWRALAKDGADLPRHQAVMRPATQRLAVGEMFDAEFVPGERGEYVLTVGAPATRMKYKRRLIVK
ncbi:MAG: multicopper oxidase domain-containing protein [Gemmatimonadaceae bacterium]|nr:multicopper oxidase domain-containing protein [Gemmatimonadaceae bacterium]